MSDESAYTELELAGLNEWHQLHHELLPEEPFKFHFMKLQSGSQELRDLIMDPLETLLGRKGLPPLEGVTEESRITTTIHRHDRTLLARLMYFNAAVDSEDNSVSLTGHKAKGK
jgi:hypothetical protein